jgi:HPt (histidine-containing phosphotransfer) domain-containing protein
MDDIAPDDCDIWRNKGAASSEDAQPTPPIDLVLLARQSLGDQNLELELLEMFQRQAARIIAQLTQAASEDYKGRADLAHRLKGSALAVGARRVAQAAGRFEALCGEAPGRVALAAALASLAATVSEAREAIVKLIA